MKTLRDASGREWTYKIGINEMDRAQAETGINLYTAENSLDIMRDGVLFARVLWAILRPEAERRGVTRESFNDGLTADVIEAALPDFIQEWGNFFSKLKPLRKTLILNAWKSWEHGQREAHDKIEGLIQSQTQELSVSDSPES